MNEVRKSKAELFQTLNKQRYFNRFKLSNENSKMIKFSF